MYSPIAMEVHAASDLQRKQRPEETVQEYIKNFTDLTEKAMAIDPCNITNHVIIFLFIKNLYNKDIRLWVAGAKTISTLADAYKLADHSLKLKKYDGLVFNDEHIIAEINQITDAMINTNTGNRPKTPDKSCKIRPTKVTPSRETVGNVNLATQQKNVRATH